MSQEKGGSTRRGEAGLAIADPANQNSSGLHSVQRVTAKADENVAGRPRFAYD